MRATLLAPVPGRDQIAAMPPEPPPIVDAEYRIVRGPWPRWAVHLGLIKLIGWGMAVSALTILAAFVLLAVLGAFR